MSKAMKPYSVKLTEETKKGLEKIAKREDRTFGYLARKILDRFVRRNK